MSSGTIGGAMEAALFRKKAVALSFAFHSREHDPKLIAGACRQSAKIIEHLCENWAHDVDLYSINVPVVDGVEERKILYTNVLQNYWSSGSSFREVDANEDDINPDDREKEIRQGVEVSSSGAQEPKAKPKHYMWAPKFSDLARSIEGSPAGNDGWAIKHDYSRLVSYTIRFCVTDKHLKRNSAQSKLHAHSIHPTGRVEVVSLSSDISSETLLLL